MASATMCVLTNISGDIKLNVRASGQVYKKTNTFVYLVGIICDGGDRLDEAVRASGPVLHPTV